MISWLHIIVLSIVQGITEFLPVSSSGHLILVPDILGEVDQGLMFDVAAHGGTLLAVMIYFWRDIKDLIKGFLAVITLRAGREQRLLLQVAAASLPGLIVGALIFSINPEMLRSPLVVATASFVFAILLWHADRTPPVMHFDQIKWRTVLIIGLSQVLAFIPGTSRSGITMTAARYLNLTRTAAARFSMLLAIPILGAALLVYGYEISTDPAITFDVTYSFIMVLVLSFIAALLSIHILLQWLNRHTFKPFVIYRILLSLVIFGFYLF